MVEHSRMKVPGLEYLLHVVLLPRYDLIKRDGLQQVLPRPVLHVLQPLASTIEVAPLLLKKNL